jgi:hypothetical protein
MLIRLLRWLTTASESRGGLYRACGVVKPGTCSAKVRRAQAATSQMNRRTVNRITTGVPASGESRSIRWYRS